VFAIAITLLILDIKVPHQSSSRSLAELAELNTTRSGWTLGIGGEYAFTDWITGFVEYDHYNFDRDSDNFVCGPVACFGRTFGFPVEVKETKDVFKVGVNFLWSPGAGGFGARY
jgi:outer membrane immunogenic protein